MIFARSPYVVEIDETPQESTRLELFIWNGTGAAPVAPSYSLSKKVPSINNNAMYYNISPFIREYFNFIYSSPYSATNNALLNQYAYCNVTYKRYYTLDGVETLIDTVETFATDGFGYYEDLSNPQTSNFLLTTRTPNVFNYVCDDTESESLNAGTITILGTNHYDPAISRLYVVYTPLSGAAAQIEVTITQEDLLNVLRVHPDFYAIGNKLDIRYDLDEGTYIVYTAYFEPQCECKYEVFNVDFINKFGAWQREFFYKASTENIEMENNKFKLNPVPFPNYNAYQGQYKNFNTNAKKIFKLNTGWVEESFKDTIQEMLLSEVIRVNGLPAILRTKSVEKFKSINTKNINYQIEFEMAYDVINTIS
jgi:hypothetical protein